MSKQYYTPNTTKPQTASVGEFKQVGLEADAIIQRVSKDLYASPASGIRELLANEIRAAIKAKEQGANPSIEVTVTDDMVRVWGRDSLGMEREIFDTVYMTLGRSSNFDGKTAGQFGLGRAAYVTISDHMLLETKHRNGDCYSVLGVEGRGYQTGLPEPDMPYGTRVTMAPKERYNMELTDMVKKMAERCPIPITLVTESYTTELEQVPLADGWPLHANRPEVEFAAKPGYDYHANNTVKKSYLCGIPIRFNYCGRYNLHSISLDILDERKFPPTPDRERMTEKAEKDMSEIIDAEIAKRMADFPRDLVKALKHPDRSLAETLLADEIPGLGRFVDVCGLHGMHGQWLYTRHTSYLKDIRGDPIINCRVFVARQINAVRRKFPKASFVKECPEFPLIADFMKQHNIKRDPPGTLSPEVERERKKVAIHLMYSTEKVDPQNPPEKYRIYKVADSYELDKYTKLLVKDNMALTIHDVRGAVDIGVPLAAARKCKFQTSRGPMTGKQLLDSETIVNCTDRASLLECWGDGPGNTPVILVLDNKPKAYAGLRAASDRIAGHYHTYGWGCVEALETYLRIEDPLHKMLLRDCQDTNKPEICAEFMRAEGKEPVG